MNHPSLLRVCSRRTVFRLLVLVLLPWITGAGCGSKSESNGGKASTSDSSGADDATRKGGGGHDPAADSTASSSGSASESAAADKRERSTQVNAALAYRGDLVVPVVAEGTIRSLHAAEIKAEISGRISTIQADEGMVVRKGALILKLDSREYEVAADEARSRYLQALSALAVEEDSVESIERPSELKEKIRELQTLEDKGAITREERLSREIALDVEALRNGAFRIDMVAARSGVTAARAALERAYLNLERTEIRAPFSGVVTGLLLSSGEQVIAGQKLCSLVNNVDLEAVVGVLEADVGHLRVGREALLVVPALDDTFRVTVGVISPQFDRSSRTCDVLLPLENPDGRVRPGMFAKAIIAGETLAARLLVPKEAILTRDGRPLLFKVENGRAVWLYVQTGRQNDAVIEVEGVLQGGSLNAGEPVVVSNHLTLSHDAKLDIKKIVPVRDPWGARN